MLAKGEKLAVILKTVLVEDITSNVETDIPNVHQVVVQGIRKGAVSILLRTAPLKCNLSAE